MPALKQANEQDNEVQVFVLSTSGLKTDMDICLGKWRWVGCYFEKRA